MACYFLMQVLIFQLLFLLLFCSQHTKGMQCIRQTIKPTPYDDNLCVPCQVHKTQNWTKPLHCIGGGTGGGGHQGHVPPLSKDLLFSAPPSNCLVRWPFWPYPVTGTRAVMAQRSLNMASSVPKTLGPGILAASNPNINLSTSMASEAISEHLIIKIFLGEHAPRPPSACVLRTHHHRCPPIYDTM